MVDQTGAQLAQQMDSRYSDDSLRGVWGDVLFLSQSEYIVCTFSSQVPRTRVRACKGPTRAYTHRDARLSLPLHAFLSFLRRDRVCNTDLPPGVRVDAGALRRCQLPRQVAGRPVLLRRRPARSAQGLGAVLTATRTCRPAPCRCRAAAPLLPCPHLASSSVISPPCPTPTPLPALSAPCPRPALTPGLPAPRPDVDVADALAQRKTGAELSMNVGDRIENHARPDGLFWKGQNMRTGMVRPALPPVIACVILSLMLEIAFSHTPRRPCTRWAWSSPRRWRSTSQSTHST